MGSIQYIVYIQLYPTTRLDLHTVHSLYTSLPNHEMGSIYSTQFVYSCTQPQEGPIQYIVYIELNPTTRWDLYRVHSLYTAVPNHNMGSLVVHSLYTAVPNPKMGSVQNVVYIHLYPLYSTQFMYSCTQPRDGIYIVHSLYTGVPNHKIGSLQYIVYIQLYPITRWDLYIAHSLYTVVPNHGIGSLQYIDYIQLYPTTRWGLYRTSFIHSCTQPRDGIYICTQFIYSCTQPRDGIYIQYIVYIQLYPTTRWGLYSIQLKYTAVPNHKMGSIQNIVYIQLHPTTRRDLYTVHSLYTSVPNHEKGSVQYIVYTQPQDGIYSIQYIVYIQLYPTTRRDLCSLYFIYKNLQEALLLSKESKIICW